jgi:hypothetical protein
MKNLSFEEQIQIFGGNDSAYNAGYWVGYWIGACAATIRNGTYLLKDIVIDAANTIEKLK